MINESKQQIKNHMSPKGMRASLCQDPRVAAGGAHLLKGWKDDRRVKSGDRIRLND